jgi:SMI1 / KNR4 family (SUKH-1)
MPRKWNLRESPANESSIFRVKTELKFLDLPPALWDLLRFSNGGEVNISVRPGLFMPWSTGELISFNSSEGYNIEEFFPDFFGFASDGGSEMFVLKKADLPQSAVYVIPFVSVEEDEAIKVADSFEDLVRLFGEEG